MTGYHPRVARGIRSFPRRDASDGRMFGLGVVGLHEGRTALIAADRTTRVRAIMGCDRDEQAVGAVRRELPELDYVTDFDAMLADDRIDIVGIYTPDPAHAPMIEAALRAGKHVLCTKPVIDSLATAGRVLEAARAASTKVMVGQSTRFFDSFRRQRAGFEAGVVGGLEAVEAHYTHRMDWYYDGRPWVAESADWIFLGMSHPLDLLAWYLGPIESVSAMGARSRLAREHGATRFDIVSVNVLDVEGRVGRAFGHYGMHELPRARNSVECLLYGDAGTSLAKYHDMEYLWVGEDGVEHVEDSLYELRHFHFNNEVHGMHYGEFANYLEHFAEAILGNREPAPGIEEGVRTVALMEAVRQSASRGGDVVRISELLAEYGLDV